MALVHISYDAINADDSDALRHDIPKAYFASGHVVNDFTEPARSTFRFEISDSAKDSGWARLIMGGFKDRCYYFISMSDVYLNEEKKSVYPSLTNKNETLNKNFQEIVERVKEEIENEDKQ